MARGLRKVETEPLVAEEDASIDLMLALVSAGSTLALVGVSEIAACCSPDATSRLLEGRSPVLTTCLHRDARVGDVGRGAVADAVCTGPCGFEDAAPTAVILAFGDGFGGSAR